MRRSDASRILRVATLLAAGLAAAACNPKPSGDTVDHTIEQQRPADLAQNLGWVRTRRAEIGGVKAQIDGMQGMHAPHIAPAGLGDVDWKTAAAELEVGEITLAVSWMHGDGAVRDVSVKAPGLEGRKGALRVVLRPLMGTDKGAGGATIARVEVAVEGDDLPSRTALVTGAGQLVVEGEQP